MNDNTLVYFSGISSSSSSKEKSSTYVKLIVKLFKKNKVPLKGSVEDTIAWVTESETPLNLIQMASTLNLDQLPNVSNYEKILDDLNEFAATSLKTEEIRVKELRVLLNADEWRRMTQVGDTLAKLLEENSVDFPPKKELRRKLNDRMEKIGSARNDLKEFLELIETLQVSECDELKRLLRKDDEELLLKETADFSQCVGIQRQDLESVNWLVKSRRSDLVVKHFAKAIRDNELNWKALIASIPENKRQLRRMLKSVVEQKMLIGQVENTFAGYFEKGYRTLSLELHNFADSVDVKLKPGIEAALEKMSCIFQLQTMNRQMENIVEVCDVLRVDAKKFAELNRIVDMANNVDENRNQAFAVIPAQALTVQNWSKREWDCLKAVAKSGKLVKWINTTMSSVQNLGNLIELAGSSTGESDIEADQIQYLRLAISSYAPLIFDLPKDGSAAFRDFCRCAEKVFRKLEEDENVPNYLNDTRKYFEKIKAVIEMHGSVEASSLSMVQSIDDNAVFTVKATGGSGKSDFRQMIKAEYHLLQDKGQRGESKTVSYDDLSGLRSKLMLITINEDGRKKVDRFRLVLNVVEVIAKHVKQLNDAGCHLFALFKMTLNMNVRKKVKVSLDLGQGHALIRGHTELENELRHISRLLNDAFEEWRTYFQGLRATFDSLNYYTTGQIVAISSALAEFAYKDRSLSSENAMLLKYSCPGITLDEIKDGVFDLEMKKKKKAANEAAKLKKPESTYDGDDVVIKRLMEEYDYSGKVAQAAVR